MSKLELRGYLFSGEPTTYVDIPDLKPCPFCGSEAKAFRYFNEDSTSGVIVGCVSCFCRLEEKLWLKPEDYKYHIDNMVKEWNTRFSK